IEPVVLGVTIPSLLVPALVIPGLLFGVLLLWPWIDRRITHDTEPHHILDRPWEQPFRAATGSAILAAFLVLTLAGGNDVLAHTFSVPLEGLTELLRAAAFVVPVVVWVAVWVIARDRRRRADRADDESRGGTAFRQDANGRLVVEEDG